MHIWPLVLVVTSLLTAMPVVAQSACNRPEHEQVFIKQLRTINQRIREKQQQIERMIVNRTVPEEQIMVMTSELISWKSRRDQLAIEYILRQRRDECPMPSFSTTQSR